MKDNTPSGAFRISSITLDSVTTTSHCSISGILKMAFGHWEKFSTSPARGQRSREAHFFHASIHDLPRIPYVIQGSEVGERRQDGPSRWDMCELKGFRLTVELVSVDVSDRGFALCDSAR